MELKRARSFLGGRARLRYLAAVCLFVGLVAEGCQSSTAPSARPCNEDPFACGAGETCWVKDCSCPSQVKTCTASACTEFNFACMPSKATASVGEACDDSIGRVSCGDGQWCVQEMDVNAGSGSCASYCDPAMSGTCGAGLSCVEIGVALVAGAPLIHVCQPTGSDAGLPFVGEDANGSPGPGGSADASQPDGSRDKLLFDALPP